MLAQIAERVDTSSACQVCAPTCPAGHAADWLTHWYWDCGEAFHGDQPRRVAHVGWQVYTTFCVAPVNVHADQADHAGSTGAFGLLQTAEREDDSSACHVCAPVWPAGHAAAWLTQWDWGGGEVFHGDGARRVEQDGGGVWHVLT